MAAFPRELSLLMLSAHLFLEARFGSPKAPGGAGCWWGELRAQAGEAAGPAPRSSSELSQIAHTRVPAGVEPTRPGSLRVSGEAWTEGGSL